MDEGDAENVTDASNVLFKSENCNVLESQETIIPKEGSCPRSSIQEFMDLLDGKNVCGNDEHFTNTLERPCTSSDKAAEGRVEELTLASYSAVLGSTSGSGMFDSVENQLWHLNQLTGRPEAGSSRGDTARTSGVSGENRQPSFGFLIGHTSDREHNAVTGKSTCSESVTNIFSPGTTRTKIISKAGFPGYFVKNTLKGKGVLFRGPTSAAPGVESLGGVVMKGINATAVSSDARLNIGAKRTILLNSDPDCGAGLEPCSSVDSLREPEPCTSVDSLREWLKSGHNELHKVSNLAIFRQILELVNLSHSKGKILLDLRPSYFKISPLEEVKYCGRVSSEVEKPESLVLEGKLTEQNLKRTREQGLLPSYIMCAKQQNIGDNEKFFMKKPRFESYNPLESTMAGLGASGYGIIEKSHSNVDPKSEINSSISDSLDTSKRHLFSVADQLEDKWYRSPEELVMKGCTFSSNVYSLGVLLFELLSSFDSENAHATAMSDLRHRILPPKFLSGNPKEAGFCIWLLHPEPSFRPTTRDILQSEVINGFEEFCRNDMPSSIHEDESEILLHFLMSMKEQKQKHASKLEEDIRCIENDSKEVEKRHLMKKSLILPCSHKETLIERGKMFLHIGDVLCNPDSNRSDLMQLRNVDRLESAYFSVRSNIQLLEDDAPTRPDCNLLKNRENWFPVHKDEEKQNSFDRLGAYFDGLCKYACYSKLEVCGYLRNGDFTNFANVICSLSFDRDEDYFAAAGVSKKIKIFDFHALCNYSVDVHYPATEISNKSKISCVCWNSYIQNYLASTDYDGVVKLWDANTGQGFYEYREHEKRAWSVDFSRLDPTKLASGSDDCSVKLWSVNEKNTLHTIKNIANVCCVQFSSHSSNLLAFGSADYKIYCYDLRNANLPWCILSGHKKAVSHVKFLDSETLVSASTDSSLKIWDLCKSSSLGLSTNACSSTLRGHTNEKNFVGLSVFDGFISCGSETNEVYTYHKSIPMPITSHKFGSIDPISGKEIDDDNGQFVSTNLPLKLILESIILEYLGTQGHDLQI
ncbi:hypothetical protein Nepgr_024509 [Nepenthes gracilis]|uniref:Uncharacterized protein n=1 Tax=Nepenthes gracilis TaxID=150966 RepID=A0AAD3Y0K3_NEPGR|nr:hypothetical protein Nepgr_024509 [Nepenthes gracilis]